MQSVIDMRANLWTIDGTQAPGVLTGRRINATEKGSRRGWLNRKEVTP